tara:strand:- start:5216 stop:5587 length:372 start_codon:yes stop_codon:yes gene_type:complete
MATKKSKHIITSVKKKKRVRSSKKQPTKIKFTTIDPDLTEIHVNGRKIGFVKRKTSSFKWDMSALFAPLTEDEPFLKRSYDSDIEAGRELSRIFFRYKEVLKSRLGVDVNDFYYSDMFQNMGF